MVVLLTPLTRNVGQAMLINLVCIFIVAFGVYYRRHRRADLALAYVALNVSLFCVAVLIVNQMKIGVAFGFGLFAILSIIRLRSEPIAPEEGAYYFVALVLGLINGMVFHNAPLARLLDVGLVAVMVILDNRWVMPRARRQVVVLDMVYPTEAQLRGGPRAAARRQASNGCSSRRPTTCATPPSSTCATCPWSAGPATRAACAGGTRPARGDRVTAVAGQEASGPGLVLADRRRGLVGGRCSLPAVDLPDPRGRRRAADPRRPQVRRTGWRPSNDWSHALGRRVERPGDRRDVGCSATRRCTSTPPTCSPTGAPAAATTPLQGAGPAVRRLRRLHARGQAQGAARASPSRSVSRIRPGCSADLGDDGRRFVLDCLRLHGDPPGLDLPPGRRHQQPSRHPGLADRLRPAHRRHRPHLRLGSTRRPRCARATSSSRARSRATRPPSTGCCAPSGSVRSRSASTASASRRSASTFPATPGDARSAPSSTPRTPEEHPHVHVPASVLPSRPASRPGRPARRSWHRSSRPSPALAAGPVKIAKIHYAQTGTNLNTEYIVFKNTSASTVRMKGWEIISAPSSDNQHYFFPRTKVAPGRTLTLYTGSGTNAPGKRYWGATSPRWDNSGDKAILKNASGTIVDTVPVRRRRHPAVLLRGGSAPGGSRAAPGATGCPPAPPGSARRAR